MGRPYGSIMTARTRLYLIRHGEVEGAGTARYNGHADVSLTERGKAQYRQLRERFADAAITACYTSDLFRCAWGADLLGVHLGVEPVIDRNLRELDIGIWEGMTWAELMEKHPDEWQARLADIVKSCRSSRESWSGTGGRMYWSSPTAGPTG